MRLFDHNEYIELTMHFRCNLKCEHCMIEDTMDRLEPESDEKFHEVLEHNAQHHRWKGIILTGSEVTLRSDLPDLARAARSHGFDHVRIQTHGMRLSDDKYCRELVDAGIDQYFVSVTAPNAEVHDFITKVPGSFDKTMKGLENLDRYPEVSTLTNTVITRQNYLLLPGIVERLGHLQTLVQMDFWNYWPMSETDDKDLIVSHLDVLPLLKHALNVARQYGRSVELKNFPECLLGEDRTALHNDQPQLIIDPDFWTEFMRNGFHQCIYREQCGSTQCLGLNTAYADKYGWHPDELTPLASPVPTA